YHCRRVCVEKKTLWILAAIAACLALVFGFIVWKDIKGVVKEQEKPEPIMNIVAEVEEGLVESEIEEYTEMNPFHEKIAPERLNDVKVREYIHKMSHQKVKADVKIGFYQMTPERINWLLESLDKSKLEHEELYREILIRWKNGDFS